jgi:hypothetical protein
MADDLWNKVEDEKPYLSSVFCPLFSGTYSVAYVKINITNGQKKSTCKIVYII